MNSKMTYDMELVDLSSASCKQYDYFILAANVEKRSRAFYLQARDKIDLGCVVSADYANFHTNIGKLEESFYDDFKGYDCTFLSVNDDSSLLKRIMQLGINNSSNVGIDITGFSIPTIYILMDLIKNVCKVNHVDVFYTEPKYYIYDEGYYDSYHISVKERKCAPILGYFNYGADEEEILTIFLGFDGGLADFVYHKLGEEGKEIRRTLVVNGFPSYVPKLKDVSLYNNEGLIDKLSKDDLMTSTANNPFDSYNVLCKILKDNNGTLLNLCTIGSKPMALGSCLFALDHKREVKVTYPFYVKTTFDSNELPGKIWRYGVQFAC